MARKQSNGGAMQNRALNQSALADFESREWFISQRGYDETHRKIGGLFFMNEPPPPPPAYVVNGGVAVHRVKGPISSESTEWSRFLGLPDYETLAANFTKAEDDPSVAGHVFLMDTPGGCVAGILDFISAVKGGEKPTVGYVDEKTLSAGVWLCSAFDSVIASPNSFYGCLGAVMTQTSVKEDWTPFTTKHIVSPQTPGKLGEGDRGEAQFTAILARTASVMLNDIAESRGVTVDALLSATSGDVDGAEGGFISSAAALDAGLIDAIGLMDDAIIAAGGTPSRRKFAEMSTGYVDSDIGATFATDSITTAPPVAHNTREANMADTDNRHGDNVVDAGRLAAAQERVAELEAALKGATVTIDGQSVTAAALLSQLNETKAAAAAAAEAVAKAEAEAESLRAAAFDADVSAALEAAHKAGKLGAGEKDHITACASEDAEVYGRDKALARLRRSLAVKAAVVPVGPAAGHDEPAEVSFADRANALAAEKGITYAAAAKMLRHGEVK